MLICFTVSFSPLVSDPLCVIYRSTVSLFSYLAFAELQVTVVNNTIQPPNLVVILLLHIYYT